MMRLLYHWDLEYLISLCSDVRLSPLKWPGYDTKMNLSVKFQIWISLKCLVLLN